MAEDKNQKQPGNIRENERGAAHQSPGRNPQDDKSAGGKQGGQDRNQQGIDGGSYKEGGQNEQTRR